MKTKFLKYSLLSMLATLTVITLKAQQTAYDQSELYNNYDVIGKDASGRTVETFHTFYKDHEYKLKSVGGKITSLYVDGVKIQPDKYAQYETVISHIKEQIRLDRIQARKDQAQALKDEAQARVDQKQAMRDQEQAEKDRQQAEKEQVQAKKDQQDALKDQAQAKLDQEQAVKDQEQAVKDQAQAKLDQEQAVKDQAQAKLDQKQAEEDQRMMKEMISDLIKDGIVPDEKSLYAVTLNSSEMTVNDKKQPEEVYKRYKEKYSRWAGNNFSYSDGPYNSRGIHMSRREE